ncbi:MAG: hypothetical protein HQL73_09560 [Magnetococcales bacterium]|nr:hypothetical protein [Magnetococcales bacterium]
MDDSYCHVEGYPPALRQTLIIVDGRIVKPEPNGPLPENQGWRKFVAQFLVASDPLTRQKVDARERVTVAVANADGSGLTQFFMGCTPFYRSEEENKLDAETSTMGRFLGNDWRTKTRKDGERFIQSALVALVENVAVLPTIENDGGNFSDSGLVSALSKAPLISLKNGIPRVIIYTDLDKYVFPSGPPVAIRGSARVDADRASVNLSYAEVHVFGAGRNQTDNIKYYLSSFFLASRGYLATLTSKDGAMNSSPIPRFVTFYQGTIDFPDALHPMRLRLAFDRNFTLVDSWVEMQAALPKFVPVFGVLTCKQKDKCQYIGDNIFAQIWDDDPNPEPDLKPWQPFGGMRLLEFAVDGNGVKGRVKDEHGYVMGRKDGLEFTLLKVADVLF